jgi:hypothetical protein
MKGLKPLPFMPDAIIGIDINGHTYMHKKSERIISYFNDHNSRYVTYINDLKINELIRALEMCQFTYAIEDETYRP